MKTVPELRFSEYKEDWSRVQIADHTFKIGSGVTPKGGESVYQDFGIPFIRSQNVNDNKLDINNIRFISEEINSDMKNSIVNPLDILLNITGASIGRSCVVPSNSPL